MLLLTIFSDYDIVYPCLVRSRGSRCTADMCEAPFDLLRGDFRDPQSSVDEYARKADTYFQEMVMLSRKVDRHDN